MNNNYNKQLKDFSRTLRTETVSKAEKYLWKTKLSKKQMGISFKRQRPIDNFIVNFFCSDLNLIIEIDGNSHLNKGSYDKYRENKLQNLGYTIIRFSESEVLSNLEVVEKSLAHSIFCLKT